VVGTLFAPAIALMNRLTYPRKFALISLLFVLPLALVMHVLISEIDGRIEFARKELAGNRYLRPLRTMLELIPEYGVMDAAAPGADRDLPARAARIDDAFARLEALDPRHGAAFDAAANLAGLRARWLVLRARADRLGPGERDDAVADLVADLRALIARVGDTSNLILDPDLDTYYLMDAVLLKLPEGQHLLARARTLGRRLLAGASGTADDRARAAVLAGLLDANLTATRTGMAIAFRENHGATLQPVLEPPLLALARATDGLVRVINQDIAAGPGRLSAAAYAGVVSRALGASFALWDRTTGELERLLEARIERFTRRKQLVVGLVALALVVVLYLWVSFYVAVMRTVSALEAAAAQMTGGNPAGPVSLATRDELGQVVKSFNSIAARLRQEWTQAREESARVRAAEGQLRESEQRFHSIVDAALDAVITIDGRGRITEWNPQAASVFGWSRGEAVGRRLSELIVPPGYREAHEAGLERFAATGEGPVLNQRIEISALHRDGREFPIELAVTPLRAGTAVSFSAFVRDITERRKMEQLKADFISTVSHELRTPLTSIHGSLGLIAGGAAGAIPAEARTMVDIAHKNSQRLVRLINDILDIEKIESGKMDFRIRAVAVTSLVEQTVEANRAYADQFGVRYLVESAVPDAEVTSDADRLAQVLTNLLSNAARFSARGDTVVVSVSRHGRAIRVAVSDRGPGIPEDFQPRIFEKFAQADVSDARTKGGTGLGLSICRAIIDRLGGHIGFETAPGAGTTFFFDLPERAEAEPAPAAPSMPVPAAAGRRPRILICEDDRDVAMLVRLMLGADFQTDIAGDAAQARRLLAQHDYAAMTLDLVLPDQDGIALVRELRQAPRTRELPIVVVSIQAHEGRQELNGGAFGIADWLDKPIDQAQLLTAVTQAASQRAGRRPRILHVEDDPDTLRVVAAVLGDLADVSSATGLERARQALERDTFDLIVLDVALPDGSGLDLLPALARPDRAPVPVVVFAAQEVDPGTAQRIAAALVKSRISNQDLLDTVRSLVSGVGAAAGGRPPGQRDEPPA
jgi:PAS domain S-box-containing protein